VELEAVGVRGEGVGTKSIPARKCAEGQKLKMCQSFSTWLLLQVSVHTT
jgi:hypothetical protein